MKGKILQFDGSESRVRDQAEKCYEEGDYLSALRFCARVSDVERDGEFFDMLSDIYENFGAFGSAVAMLFRAMDKIAEEGLSADLSDIYEGLAVNYLNLGNEEMSAYYYNLLMNTDDTLSEENKREIISLFEKKPQKPFRFVYPPELTDFTKETEEGGTALKNGDVKGAIGLLSKVERGSKAYPVAQELMAIAYLLDDQPKKAEKTCLNALETDENNVQVLSTLSAVYTHQGREEESREIAVRLCSLKAETPEEKYKIATVCCENGLNEEALKMFVEIGKEMPFDGNLLYFKAVAAMKTGKLELAKTTLETLCTVYPDAEVAKYYLHRLRKHLSDPENVEMPETTYFYRVPTAERIVRWKTLAEIGKRPKEDALLLGEIMSENGYFTWCFDEMDGMDKQLQSLGISVAAYAKQFAFLREILLDPETDDTLKIDVLRLFFEENEDDAVGVVVCGIYHRVYIEKLSLGRNKRQLFLDAYADLSSKFSLVGEQNAQKIHDAAKRLYGLAKEKNAFSLFTSAEDVECALYLCSKMRGLGKTAEEVAPAFGANKERVEEILKLNSEGKE